MAEEIVLMSRAEQAGRAGIRKDDSLVADHENRIGRVVNQAAIPGFILAPCGGDSLPTLELREAHDRRAGA
jgi:hypothetical protein